MKQDSSLRFLWILLAALLAWGVLLAVGTLIFPGRLAVYRAAIIFGCTLLFAAFWALMLLLRQLKQRAGERGERVNFPPPGT